MSYTMYTPLNVWLDPASITDVVAYIQTYLRDNPIYSEEEIEEQIHDYLIAHPELIGGVQSVNGKTGTVVLSASDINTANNVTIESVLASLSSQISSIASSVATNTANITNLTGRVTTAETDISNLKSAVNQIDTTIKTDVEKSITQFAPNVDSIESGLIDTFGVIQSNSDFKTTKYIAPNGAKTVSVSRIYVADSTFNYSVISAFDENGTFLGALNNNDITPNGLDRELDEWTLPFDTAYIKVSFGDSPVRSFNVIFHGIFNYTKNKYVFNGVLASSGFLQWWFHVPVSAIGANTKTVALNTKLKFNAPITNYQIYVITYDANYTNRKILTHYDTNTEGIDGNNLTLSINLWQLTTEISNTAAYAGIMLNITPADPVSTTIKTNLSRFGFYYAESEYCLINGVQVTTNYYPGGSRSYVNEQYNTGYNPMLGGRLCCLGDSLTGVYYKDETESWPYLIGKWNSMNVDNLGVSGCPLANNGSYDGTSISERVDNLTSSKYYTHIFVMAGANDYNLSIPIGLNTDTAITTFKGAINHTIEKLIEKYPTAKIVFATTYRRTTTGDDKAYADAMIEVCKLNSIPCLNNYEESGVQMQNSKWMAVYGADGTTSNKHLNALGDLFVAPRFERALKYGI